MKFRFQGIEFGGRNSPLIVEPSFDAGAPSARLGDWDSPGRDGAHAGRDFVGSRLWAFTMRTNGENLDDARAVDAELSAAWMDPSLRLVPGTVVPLFYDLGETGVWRCVFGRPHPSYAGINGGVLDRQGAGQIVADFRVLRPYHYSADEFSTTVTAVPESTGGLVAPLVAPLTVSASGGSAARFATNGGNADGPVRLVFQGPSQNPSVELANGWWFGLNHTLAFDERVEVDAMTGLVSRWFGTGDPVPDYSLVAGRSSPVTSLHIPPGEQEFWYSAADATGTSSVTVFWRDAHTNI